MRVRVDLAPLGGGGLDEARARLGRRDLNELRDDVDALGAVDELPYAVRSHDLVGGGEARVGGRVTDTVGLGARVRGIGRGHGVPGEVARASVFEGGATRKSSPGLTAYLVTWLGLGLGLALTPTPTPTPNPNPNPLLAAPFGLVRLGSRARGEGEAHPNPEPEPGELDAARQITQPFS